MIVTENLIQHLSQFITKERYELFKQVLEKRTNYITLGLEDIYQAQNASAVLRTCDCFGIQDVHIIENQHEYAVNPDVALGSNKWLNLHKYNEDTENTISTINKLKNNGYRIIATTPHTNDVNLEEFDLNKGKFALFFGTELNGLTNKVLDNADEYLKIPMYGFTESFNISVSASIILHHLTMKLRASDINWQLSKEEKDSLLLKWLKNSIKKVDLILKDYAEKNNLIFDKIISI